MIQFSNAVAGEPLTNWQVLFAIQMNYLDCKLKYNARSLMIPQL